MSESSDLIHRAEMAQNDEEVIDVIREAVTQLETVTGRLQSFLDNWEG